jgi:hypothetical protein
LVEWLGIQDLICAQTGLTEWLPRVRVQYGKPLSLSLPTQSNQSTVKAAIFEIASQKVVGGVFFFPFFFYSVKRRSPPLGWHLDSESVEFAMRLLAYVDLSTFGRPKLDPTVWRTASAPPDCDGCA